ncbi:MAG: thermonuclease family protein [Candidatus Eisenbacteria bacterium]|uniref:Thermonuclease family protein n=1 Tax=Eiseniibacteriota bacterium TaxID=2212470 RepID=A0A956RPX1_UNCEI|nr:thermonuclease family protein [Candidatus Eisenbacteria bacterium]
MSPSGHRWWGPVSIVLLFVGAAGTLSPARAADPKPQTRPSMQKVAIEPSQVRVDDGDTVWIDWGGGDRETIRILGIDTPEIQHLPHDLPYDQTFGRQAMGFAQGAFAVATQVQLLRAATTDPYGRTLGYLFLDGKNYSALVVAAGLAAESVSFYGDNGLPEPAQEVLAASKTAPPLAFEPPHEFRRRMRDLSKYLREKGQYPE